jgi:hypothetical protein
MALEQKVTKTAAKTAKTAATKAAKASAKAAKPQCRLVAAPRLRPRPGTRNARAGFPDPGAGDLIRAWICA